MERRRDCGLHAKLIRLMRLAFANTFNLWPMQAIDFLSWSPRTLQTHALCKVKWTEEDIDQLDCP